MPRISQDIQDIVGGIATVPPKSRTPDQWADLLNTMVYDGRTLGTRPGTRFISEIALPLAAGDPVTALTITRSATERYIALVLESDLKVFDALSGQSIPVEAPAGFTYLTDAFEGYRWLTTGDRTVLTNRSRLTAKGTRTAPATDDSALVVVRQGNFGTKYTIKVGGFTFTHTTPASTATSPEAAIATDVIAEELYDLMQANTGFTALYTVTRFGSALHIVADNVLSAWTATTEDGLGNEGMAVIRGSTQRFEDLPEQAPDGLVVEIKGDASTAFDNYWVQYDTATSAWVETTAPQTVLGFDLDTLPHVLEYGGKFLASTPHVGLSSPDTFSNPSLALDVNALLGKKCRNLTDGSEAIILSNTATSIVTAGLAGGGNNAFREGDLVEVVGYGRYFLFGPGPWAERPVGNGVTNPDPSFLGKAVRDVSIVQGRLALVSSGSVVFSRAGEPFHLFRKKTTLVEADGPIDITETLPSSAKFHTVFDWDGKVFVWSDLGQYEVLGDPILSPQTITFRLRTAYPNVADIRPVVAGSRVFYVGLVGGRPKVRELTRAADTDGYAAQDLTDHLPGYLEGTPSLLSADEEAGVLLLTTTVPETEDTDLESRLYVMTYRIDGERLVRWAWQRWFFLLTE